MQQLTSAAEQAVQSLAQRYGVSTDAVTTLLFAVSAGGGTMAQFYHPELGGGGQWMQGGMTMVGDMFNGRLQSTVSGLCAELSSLLGSQQVFLPAPASTGNGFMQSSNAWWPSELGQPSSSGGQNDTRYAYFPAARRLAVSRGGQVTVYDTLDHQIGGVQQQQGGPYGSQSFTSQFGTFTVESLPSVGPQPFQQAPQAAPQPAQSSNQQAPQRSEQQSSAQPGSGSGGSHAAPDILNAIERLGQLHERGILSDDEFRSKKAELLARL
jgi:putative oligomerization/nucleic acid binding protein